MGHYKAFEDDCRRGLEVYEFQSYGMLVLAKPNEGVEIWVARPGDKVTAPNGCWVTLYNLGDQDNPLITLSFSGREHNQRDTSLAATYGPILLAYYNDSEVVLRLNQLYIDDPHQIARFQLSDSMDPEICIARRGRLDLDSFLYNELTHNPDVIGRLARLNVSIKHASSEAILGPLSSRGSQLYFSMPLVEATKQGGDVYCFFFPGAARAVPGQPVGNGIAAVEAELYRYKQKLIRLEPLDRPLVVVVEGTGDWVRDTYRRLFEMEVAKGHELAVIYANDERWSPRPEWADSLQLWESYLNKARTSDFDKYKALNPDVVFVVTPDFTHSHIARAWLGRSPVSPIVFVEKPFDSQVSNVEALLMDLGRRPGTEVLGLDHYQFYALPIHKLQPQIEQHLGGGLAKVIFYMAEARPIEKGRDHTLQFGLTLDLLPHLLALLTYFGDVSTIDHIQVMEVGRYDPLQAVNKDDPQDTDDISKRFRNETFSRIRFSFQDYSGNKYPVPCEAAVGKGCGEYDIKYIEVSGTNGNAVRVDFSSRPGTLNSEYPWKALFFMLGDGALPPVGTSAREMTDPYDQNRRLRILQQPFPFPIYVSRYEELLDDLLEGTSHAVSSALLLQECEQIVLALDRIWRAIQEVPQWMSYAIGSLNVVQQQPAP